MAGAAWIIPAAAQAYEHREQISGAWRRISQYLLGKKTTIAITGLKAAAKTVLFNHITEKAFNTKYPPPGKPPQKKKGSFGAKGKNMVFWVIPGKHPKA